MGAMSQQTRDRKIPKDSNRSGRLVSNHRRNRPASSPDSIRPAIFAHGFVISQHDAGEAILLPSDPRTTAPDAAGRFRKPVTHAAAVFHPSLPILVANLGLML